LTAGCLFQTVWNALSGFEPTHGIVDYDVFYCDTSDLTWEKEDSVIRLCAQTFADLGVDVQPRNQARVHLWYEKRFEIPCSPLRSSQDGIDSFLNMSSCFGVHQTSDRPVDVYAPFGFSDLFDMVVRPNAIRNLPDVYYEKANRWSQQWPRLKVHPWPKGKDN
jgi:hypothetical protein